MFKYAFEAIVIISGILLSFYIEELRIERKNINQKNEILIDLKYTAEDDLKQIILIESILLNTIESVELLLKDIKNNHSDLTDREAVENIFNIEVATSFIPKDGIYNELISTGSFELIKNRRLKITLLEVYNHLKERNYTISRIIDDDIQDFYATYRKEFKLTIDNLGTENQNIYGRLVVEEFEFDLDYFLSGALIGELTTVEFYSRNYLSLLNTTKNSYHQLIVLLDEELVKI
tara:strand:+ start:218 stop:919 length:702 start_codon:yes stop_codon:yes gene_type:complete